jgi:hypothetical protein
MTADITFAPLDQPDVTRDRWERPLIIPRDGGEKEVYARVSTLAKSLDSKEGLMQWMQRMTAIGLGKRPDLAERAAITDPTDKRALKEIVDGAMKAAESDRAANVGTTLHKLTEQMDRGTLDVVPAHYQPHLDAYATAMDAPGASTRRAPGRCRPQDRRHRAQVPARCHHAVRHLRALLALRRRQGRTPGLPA